MDKEKLIEYLRSNAWITKDEMRKCRLGEEVSDATVTVTAIFSIWAGESQRLPDEPSRSESEMINEALENLADNILVDDAALEKLRSIIH
jgi:hypothetical protein